MVTPVLKESPRKLHSRVVRLLKEQGYSLKGCQLVKEDFEILDRVLKEENCRDRVEFYLELCRMYKIVNGLPFGEQRYAFVRDCEEDPAILSSSKYLCDIQQLRYLRRLNRCSVNTCCMI